MKQLTQKEEEIMDRYWQYGPMQIRELQTLSTLVKILEEKGFLGHRALTARCFEYFARISREEYRGRSLAAVVDKLFGHSYLSAVSTLVKSEKISVDELKALIRDVEDNR